VIGLFPWGQSLVYSIGSVLVLFHGVGLWSHSMGSVFGLIPLGQYLFLFHGISTLSYSMGFWSYYMGSVFGQRPKTDPMK
jgi:hypothetical protein